MYKNVVTILTNPALLRTESDPFPPRESWTEYDHKVVQDLLDTFNVLQGYGLAAPQIGYLKRAIVVDTRALGIGEHTLLMINPQQELSEDVQRNKEACFSVPHVSASVTRAQSCTVKYLDVNGEEQSITASGFPAACLQHEIDHLDGKTYLDRIGSAWRNMLKNKIRKTEKKRVAKEREAQEEFDREHAAYTGNASQKTKITHSRKRKPKARKKRPSRSKKK